jgi:hypothetical protein
MKRFGLLMCLSLMAGCTQNHDEIYELSSHTAPSSFLQLPQTNRFRVAWEAWNTAIDNSPIRIISSSEPYLQIPEWKAIVDLGEPALNDMYHCMKEDGGLSHFLFWAVIEIKGWSRKDLTGASHQACTLQVITALRLT